MERDENIEITRILDILNAKKIFIVLMLIFFIALGYLYSYYYTVPEYKSTSTLLLIPNNVKNESVTNSDLTLNSGLISTYGNIAKNPKLLKQVINNLQLDMSEEELLSKIQINIVKDTHIMEIAVTDYNAQTAMNITKELSNVFLNEIKQIYNLNNIGIVDEAQLPSSPYNINHMKDIGIFFVIGIVISSVYVMLIYLLDNTVKKEEDLEKYINIESLGNIPINDNNKESEIINRNDAKSYVTECINTIRTNILYMNSAKNAKTILITSCTPREGKSWTSTNVAVAFAETNKKVLLVDADMRKGRIHKIFDVDNEQGLSNYLFNITGDVEKDIYLAKDYIKETQFPGLHILTNGVIPPNPSELLESSYMKELIGILKNIYDVIIIDAPPCKLVTDSVILSTIVDSTVLVTNSGKTKISDLKEVKKSINNVNGKIIGAIINKVKLKGKIYSKKYYYGDPEIEDYEISQKTITTIDELIESAIPKLEAKDFNLFLYENDLLDTKKELESEIEEVNNNFIENKEHEDIQQFIKDQNKYLQRVVSTVSEIKSQLNTNIMEDKLQNKKQSKILQDSISQKLEEIKEQRSVILKDEIQDITNSDELNKISDEIENVRENYEDILEQIKDINGKNEDLYNIYPDEIDSIYSEIKDVKENYKQIIQEIKDNNKNVTDELIQELNDKRLTREEIKEIFKEEIPNNTKDIDNIYNEIKDVKENYKQIIKEIKENNENNTHELIQQLNNKRLTGEEVKEILREEVSNNIYTNQIERIYDEVKESKHDYQRIVEEIQNIPNASGIDTIAEQLNQNNATSEEMLEILKDRIVDINYSEDIENIYNKIEDTKINYAQTIEEIVDINNEKLMEVLKREEKNKEQIQNLLNDKIEEMQEKNQEFLREEISSIDYTEQINQMNEMITNLKDSYLELSNMVRANDINKPEISIDDVIKNQREDAEDNIIDIKLLKKQKEQAKEKNKSYSIEGDIPYSELEKTATCIIRIQNKKNVDFSDETYESIM